MAQSIGGPFSGPQIPEGSDPADIIRALRLYHYGSEGIPSTADDITGGIASHLKAVQDAVASANIGETVVNALQTSSNLNFTDDAKSGFYYRSFNLTESDSTDRNYPINSNGLLTHTKASGEYFQTYISTSDAGYWWRVGTKPEVSIVWGLWQKAASSAHTHDDRYFTETEISTKVNMTNMASSRAAIVSSSGQLTSSSLVTQTQLETLRDISTESTLKQQLDLKAPSLHYHDDRYYLRSDVTDGRPGNKKTVRVFVQSTTPSSSEAQVGDIWLW
jgi:hypothetical protein